MNRCELTHQAREPIDLDRATAQHRAYVDTLRDVGCRVHELPADPNLPDCVFVEDTAVVVGDAVVLTRPGAPSRRGEVESIRSFLADYLELHSIEAPGTLDGGDVLRLGRTFYVGASERTNASGTSQLRNLVAPWGYDVVPVAVSGCLHLKSAVTEVADGVVLLQPIWADASVFADYKRIEVDPREPNAANALRVGRGVLFPAAFPRTAMRLGQAGIPVRAVDVSELAKAEGAVTCCSLTWED